MKKVFYLLFALLTAVSFISCDTEDPTAGEVQNTDIKLSISTSSLQYDADGGTQLITISTNAKFAGAESYVEWINFKLNNTQLQVIVQPNPTMEERTSTICISVGETADFLSTQKKQNYVYATVTQKGSSSQIKAARWVLVGYESQGFTPNDIAEGNSKKYNPNYHTDSLEIVADKGICSGFYSETFVGPGSWHNGTFLFRFEVSQIPQELEGGGTITLYDKVSLPRHYGGYDDHNDYAEYAYYHCFCYPDCRIDGNKIRSREEDFEKFNGYNLPVVIFNENQADLFYSEGYIYGDVPRGKKAGDRIQLTIDAVEGAGGPALEINGKYMKAAYTYEWRE